MNKSESINELATALCKAQAVIEDATKSKSGHNYKYADLSQILNIVRPAFTANGLSVSQFPTGGGDSVSVDTILMHSSGQWISQDYSMEVVAGKGMSKAQAAGSVITYMRRYALAAIAGITQEDNDAAIARKEENKQNEPKISREQSNFLYPFITRDCQSGEGIEWSPKGQEILDIHRLKAIEDLPASKFEEVKRHLGIK